MIPAAAMFCASTSASAHSRALRPDGWEVVTEAAWTLSAGPDAARLDTLQGNEIPDYVAHQRWVMNQVLQATLSDQVIADAFSAVSFMVDHPSILADRALLEQAIRANKSVLRTHRGDSLLREQHAQARRGTRRQWRRVGRGGPRLCS